MTFRYNDGGRADAGFRGETGDCGVRAVAIATGKPYREVYQELGIACKAERPSKRKSRKSHPRTGIHRDTLNKYLKELGWTWTPTMEIGSGCRVHLRPDELPAGRIIVRLSRHYAAVVDGILNDIYDCSRGGTRCVYGYWMEVA